MDDETKNLFRQVGHQYPLEHYIHQSRALVKRIKKLEPVVVFNLNAQLVPTLFGTHVDAIWLEASLDNPIALEDLNNFEEFPDSSEVGTSSSSASVIKDIAILENPREWVGHATVNFSGHTLHVMGLIFGSTYSAMNFHYAIAGPTVKIVEAFLQSILKIKREKRLRVMRHYISVSDSRGIPRGDKTWDDVILAPEVKETLETNVEAFFKAGPMYKKYGLAYRRGILLVGPPGDGKSSIFKILASKYRDYSFFMFGFGGKHNDDPIDPITRMFRRASEYAPSVVLIEDLDRIADERTMRSLLNLLDGIEANSGVMVLASSNNPEKIDRALIERPSRFDLVLRIDNPDFDQRYIYLKQRFATINVVTDVVLKDLAEKTDKYSMAMLQELFTGAMLESVQRGREVTLEDILNSRKRLAKSLRTAKHEKTDEKPAVGFSAPRFRAANPSDGW